jgi:hypothetical protein
MSKGDIFLNKISHYGIFNTSNGCINSISDLKCKSTKYILKIEKIFSRRGETMKNGMEIHR